MTQKTNTVDFTGYHVVNCRGEVIARTKSLNMARMVQHRVVDEEPKEAPVTIHRTEAVALERRYSRSGTVYEPVNPRTQKERRLARSAA